MVQSEKQAQTFFSQPTRQIALMLIIVMLAGFGGYIAFPRVQGVFLANPLLNGFIAFVFVIGVVACFWQVLSLVNSVNWIEGFAADRPGYDLVKAPRLLAPLASLLRTRGARSHISASSSRSILDSVATRIDEARDITRYITSLLIFLGLLGTFYGLATTVPAVVETIRSLAPQEGDTAVGIFSRLMGGLEKQLGGMGVAFSSSLLGLTGSLVVGLLELFAGHGQNRFYRELEEWLSTITRLGFSTGDGDGGDGAGAASAVLEQFAEQMDALQVVLAQGDAARSVADERLGKLTKTVEALVATMSGAGPGTDNAALAKIAASQEKLVTLMTDQAEAGGAHVDAESRMRLRSIDVQLLRILEEMSAGRQESLADLRSDLSALTKAVRVLAENRRS